MIKIGECNCCYIKISNTPFAEPVLDIRCDINQYIDLLNIFISRKDLLTGLYCSEFINSWRPAFCGCELNERFKRLYIRY